MGLTGHTKMAGRVLGSARRRITYALVTRDIPRKSSFNDKVKVMSILRLAVEAHGRKTNQGIREILASAYYKKYQKPMPETSLMEDVRRWNHGECNIPYLYDFIIGAQASV